MFCTQMRLAERRDPRFSLPPQTTTNGIIQRPCLVKNLENNNSKNADIKHGTNEYNFEFLTPRTDRSKKNSKRKPPLIVFSLKMESDVKTLAQDDVKRDPRRLPFFCEQYKQNKKDQQQRNTNAHKDLLSSGDTTNTTNKLSNELMVRGIEMLTDQNQSNINESNTNDTSNIEHDHNIDLYSNKYYNFFGDGKNFDNFDCDMMTYPKELMKIKLTDCCQCMRDVKLLKINNSQNENNQNEFKDNILLPITKNQIDDSLFGKNRIGNGVLKAPLPSFVFSSRSRPLRNIPSPRTRQIINITMHTKK